MKQTQVVPSCLCIYKIRKVTKTGQRGARINVWYVENYGNIALHQIHKINVLFSNVIWPFKFHVTVLIIHCHIFIGHSLIGLNLSDFFLPPTNVTWGNSPVCLGWKASNRRDGGEVYNNRTGLSRPEHMKSHMWAPPPRHLLALCVTSFSQVSFPSISSR